MTTDLVTDPESYLFVTEVGSRMWGMAKFASDYDLFHVYQTPSRKYLVSGDFGSTKPASTWVDSKKREIRKGLCWRESCPHDMIGGTVSIPRRCPHQKTGELINSIDICPHDMIGGSYR